MIPSAPLEIACEYLSRSLTFCRVVTTAASESTAKNTTVAMSSSFRRLSSGRRPTRRRSGWAVAQATSGW